MKLLVLFIIIIFNLTYILGQDEKIKNKNPTEPKENSITEDKKFTKPQKIISEKDYSLLEQKLQLSTSELSSLRSQISSLQSRISTLNNENSQYKSTTFNIEKKLNNCMKKQDGLNIEINKLQQDIKNKKGCPKQRICEICPICKICKECEICHECELCPECPKETIQTIINKSVIDIYSSLHTSLNKLKLTIDDKILYVIL